MATQPRPGPHHRQRETAMHGRTVLVTGGTGGIGKQTARALAALGARVIVVGRDPDRARAAARDLASGGAAVTAHAADLTRLDGLRRLATEITDRHDRIDVLVNNLGGQTARRTLTADGVETTFAANVLAPYALTCLLLPLLRAAGSARVVNLTGGIPGGRIDPANLQGEKTYLGWTFSQYNHAKTALMAMSRRYAAHLTAPHDGPHDGPAPATASAVTVNVAYPGHAYTPGNQAQPARAFPYAYRPLVPLLHLLGPRLLGDTAKPAHSSVHLATSPTLDGVTGIYVNSRARRVPWPPNVLDEHAGDAVWNLCHHLTNLTPDP